MGRLLHLCCNVRDRQAVFEAFAIAQDEWGGCDVLINSAGIVRPGPSETLLPDDWYVMVDVHLTGAMWACQAAFPALAASERAAIVNISSAAGRMGMPHRASYYAV